MKRPSDRDIADIFREIAAVMRMAPANIGPDAARIARDCDAFAEALYGNAARLTDLVRAGWLPSAPGRLSLVGCESCGGPAIGAINGAGFCIAAQCIEIVIASALRSVQAIALTTTEG